MRVRITKSVKRIMCMVLATILLVSVPALETQAAELQMAESEYVEVLEFVADETTYGNGKTPMARTALYNCLINVYCSSDGMLVDFLTCSAGTATIIGVKDIKVQKKVWYGWKTVATSTGGEWEDSDSYAGHILYTGAEYDETYRITCVHYADVDGYHELDNEIDSFVFTY